MEDYFFLDDSLTSWISHFKNTPFYARKVKEEFGCTVLEVDNTSKVVQLLNELRSHLTDRTWRGFGDGSFPTMYIWVHSLKMKSGMYTGKRFIITQLESFPIGCGQYDDGIHIYAQEI